MIYTQYKNQVKPIFVSTCSGVDGPGKAAKQAGFDCLYQSDTSEIVEAVFHLNYGQNSAFALDDYRTNEGIFERISIEDVTYESMSNYIENHCGRKINRGEVDLYVSCSPCPDGSGANPLRTPFASRNKLMYDQYRIAGDLRTKVALFENVDGFLDKPMKDFMADLDAVRKRYSHQYYFIDEVLNAKYYGSKQDRERFMTLMVDKDLGIKPTFPDPMPVNPDNYLHKLIPEATKIFTEKKPVSTYNRLLGTMTASGKIYFLKNGIRTRATIGELLKLSDLEGYNLDAIVNGAPLTYEEKQRLLGNMVQIPFAYYIISHIKSHILSIP